MSERAASKVTSADQKLAAEAYAKISRGEKPDRSEQAALRRFEKAREEQLRWEYYAAIPQKHWIAMSGRQAKVLNEQAVRYAIPFSGRTINLPAVVRAMHDWFTKVGRRMQPLEDEGDGDNADLMMRSLGSSPALEKWRTAKAQIAELELAQKQGLLLDVETARPALWKFAALMRDAGERLQQRYGREAREILDHAIDAAEEEIATMFGEQE